jgi:hypothetical protein
MEATNIEISVKGITTTLTLDNRTAELFQEEILALLKRYPNDFGAYVARFGVATLVNCGYCINCQDNDMPMIFTIEDFVAWAEKQAETQPGIDLIQKVSNLYLKLAEG